jgi:eukaryotic-like serine/threonine-protein kinase
MSTDTREALIARLLDLPLAARTDYLRRACADHPGLRESLHQLAQAASASDPAELNGAVPSNDADRVRVLELGFEPQESTSTMIGSYKLLQRIGEGGFGVVWLAEQQEPVRRCVALKVIKSGMDTYEVIARFEAERQALALMDHPNIARVFDAGETDTGRPYFVMELVRGIPITRYCDENRVPTEARLHLFITVCHAVQHAHQKGIIHRDLKPSNIIVTLHDGVPVPKVIDFGIAKATEARLTEKTLFTRFHAFIGTPVYTSPEQMEMSGLDVDTRSDIYSLGVLLYELLAGRPPFDPDELLKSSLEEMRRIIREIEPPRPSHRVRTFPEELRTTVARQRGTDAVRLAMGLRGDLDWIVMHCLEKDRTRRYDTANTLAADVRHFLSDEPVLARPPSTSYRLRKFARRHRLGLVVGAATSVALLGSLVAVSASLVREQAARARESALRSTADENASRAQTAAVKSAAVAQFMTDMLAGVGPSVALGRDTALLRDILDATARRLDTELRDQPAVAADLRDTLGAVYFDLGQYATAEPLLRDAVALHRTVSGNESAETAAALHRLGATLRRLNRTIEAEAALQEALATRRKFFGGEDLSVADTLYELAGLVNDVRSSAERHAIMESVLAIRRKALGDEHPKVAQAIAGLGYTTQEALGHEQAVQFHAEGLAMRRRLLGNDHPDVAASLDALGYSITHLGQVNEGAAAYREAFGVRRRVLGDQHPRMVVSLLRFTGQLSAQTVDPDALALVREFVASQRNLLPRESFLLAPSLLALASLVDLPNRPEEAQALVTEAREILEKARRAGAPLDGEIITAMDFSAWSKFVAGHPAEARTLSEEALKLAHAAFGPDASGTLQPTRSLACIYRALRRWEESAKYFEAALRLSRTHLGERHIFVYVDLADLAACYSETDRVAEAHQCLGAVLAPFDTESKLDGAPPYIAHVICELGLTLIRESRFAEAEDMLRQAMAHYRRPGIRSLSLRMRPPQRAASGLARALAAQGKFSEAEPLVVQAFEDLRVNQRQLAGDQAGMVREALDAVIAVYDAWGKPEKVAEWRARVDELSVPP